MRRMTRTVTTALALGACSVVASPSVALADGFEDVSPSSLASGIVALIAAIALMTIVLQLERVARVGAVVCLAASVLAGWVAEFLPTEFTVDQARLGSDLLVIVSMVLFGVYFYRVRKALTRYMQGHPPATESDDALVEIQVSGDKEQA